LLSPFENGLALLPFESENESVLVNLMLLILYEGVCPCMQCTQYKESGVLFLINHMS